MSRFYSSIVRRDVLIIVLLILAGFAFKFIYLKTAESSYNIEELPLSALTLVGDTHAQANVSKTRLYGTAYITTAMSLETFGFTPLGLKFPNMVLFFISLVFLSLFSRRLTALRERSAWLLPAALLVMGPPVIQIWGMKNRGGFIETICALTICLWICARPANELLPSLHKLVLAIIIGLAIWSQPIALVWGVIVIAYVLWQEASLSPKTLPQSFALMGAGVFIGLLPLINLNYLFNFNTFAVLGQGETVEGIDLGLTGRFREMLIAGVPRLLGLKEQWSPDWVLWAPAARILYLLFLLPCIWASINIALDFFRTRKIGPEMLVLAVTATVIGANIVSSWGNFQGEPRRLLLLYVPFAVLTGLGLVRARRFLIPFLLLWCCFNVWVNYVYIGKHRNGFSQPVYQRLDEIAKYLRTNKIQGVYTDVWIGGRVTFASQGKIPWYPSHYQPTPHGYVGDDVLNTNEAMLFSLSTPDGKNGRNAFLADVQGAGIACKESILKNIAIIHCNRKLVLSQLALEAARNRQKPKKSGEVVLALATDDKAVATHVGIKRDGAIVSDGRAGFLMYGPYRRVPAGDYVLEVSGTSSTPFALDVATDQGARVLGRVEMAAGQDAAAKRLARLEFDLERPVSDLEIRINVGAGSDARVEGYRLLAR